MSNHHQVSTPTLSCWHFAISTGFLFWILAIFAGGEQEGSGITILRRQLEAVHKIVIGTEGRQLFGGRTADEEGR